MDVLRRLLPIALALLAPGCEFVHQPTPLDLEGERTLVHGVLEAGSDTVSIFLIRVDSEGDPSRRRPLDAVKPLSGARVWIIGARDTVRLREAPPGFPACFAPRYAPPEAPADSAGRGCYAGVLPGGVRAGARYELRIEQPNGKEISGVAVVPERPTLLAPAAGARIRVDEGQNNLDGIGGVSIRWRLGEGAAGVEAYIELVTAYRGGRAVPGARCGIFTDSRIVHWSEPVDSTVLEINALGCSIETDSGTVVLAWDSIQAQLYLTAYDSAYTGYVRAFVEGSSVEPDRVSEGVDGALGVFAGAASRARPIVLVRAEER